MKDNEIEKLRLKIDDVDSEILNLLSKRSGIVSEIGEHKSKNTAVVDLNREEMMNILIYINHFDVIWQCKSTKPGIIIFLKLLLCKFSIDWYIILTLAFCTFILKISAIFSEISSAVNML